VLPVRQWASNQTGLDDWYTGFCFDRAVIRFGSWIESKLYEMTDDGKPRHKLEDLLKDGASDKKRAPTKGEWLAMFGMGGA
jgi:hypothetical protein